MYSPRFTKLKSFDSNFLIVQMFIHTTLDENLSVKIWYLWWQCVADCRFTDPTTVVTGVQKYVAAVKLLFDPDLSQQELISIDVVGPRTIEANWRLGGYGHILFITSINWSLVNVAFYIAISWVCIRVMTFSIYYTFWNFGTVRMQPPFQSFKMARHRWQHVEQMVEGGPMT